MAKYTHPDVVDAALTYVKTNATKQVLCSAQPTTYAEANATFKLAEVTMVNGDFTLANGDVSGRKVTVSAKSAVPVTTSGTGNHVALLDVANSKLLMVSTCASTAVAAAGTVDIGAWKDEFTTPT